MSDYMEYAEYYKKAWENSLSERTTELQDEIKTLRAENARYREALGFYAEAWELGYYNGDLLVRKIGSYDAFEEAHERAREALRGDITPEKGGE